MRWLNKQKKEEKKRKRKRKKKEGVMEGRKEGRGEKIEKKTVKKLLVQAKISKHQIYTPDHNSKNNKRNKPPGRAIKQREKTGTQQWENNMMKIN